MHKNAQHQFYNDLIPNLWTEFMFFIPENQIPKEVLDKVDFFKNHDVLNKLFVIDYDNGPMHYSNERDNKALLLKDSGLNENIFQLLEKKTKTEPHEFNYIIEKYYEQINFLFYVSNWMLLNIDSIGNVGDHEKGCFIIQNNQYKKHYTSIVKHFYPTKSEIPQSDFNSQHLIDTYFKDVSNGFTTKPIEVPKEFVKPKSTIVKKKLPQKQEKKKTPLITEKDASIALLKAYFQINQ